MKKIKAKFAVLAAVSAILMCGCGNVDGVYAPANSENDTEQVSVTTSGLTENSASAEKSQPDENSEFPSKCKIYRQTTVQFTDEQLFDLFN